MKKLNLKLTALFAIAFCLISSSGWASTYYVRTADGGTSAECDGTHDAAQSGATDSGDPGSLPDCAFEHYYYALGWCGDNTNDCTDGPFVGGDTLIIKDESVSGYTSGLAGCSTGYPYACVSQPIPSGSAGNETKIYGANHASCNDDYSNTTKVWGRERVAHIFDLAGNDNIVFKCLDLTDKSSCVFNAYSQAQDGSSSFVCKREGSYPFGDHADVGIKSLTGVPTNITLDHVKITGLVNGIYAQKKTNWTADYLYLGFNSSVNWDNDIDGEGATTGNHDAGNIVLTHYTNIYAGCGEVWNSRGTPYYCTSQTQSGYGDGHSTGGGNNANYTFRDCLMEHNVSDDIDNLYDDGTSTTMKVERCQFQGSSGQSIKSAAQTTYVENVVAIGNCGYFEEQSFTTYSSTQSGRSGSNCDHDSVCDNNENSLNCPCVGEPPGDPDGSGTLICGTASDVPGNGDCPAFDNCRAQSVLSFSNKTGGQKWYNKNSTFYSNGDTIMTMNGANTCDSGTLYDNRNSVFIGGSQHTSGPDTADFFFSDGSGSCHNDTFDDVTGDYNYVVHTKNGSSDITGQSNSTYHASDVGRFVGPVPLDTSWLTDEDVIDNFYLDAATNDANESVTCQGDCSVDYQGYPRGTSSDIGAIEFGSSPTAFCGNGTVDSGEDCDGSNLNSATCITQDFDSGTLACSSSCEFDTSGCSMNCGNGTINSPEQCDGVNLNSQTCVTQGYDTGTLACKGDCTFNISGCQLNCGNSVINSGEQCDRSNLNGKTCVTQGYDSGTLACNANCTLNVTSCVNNFCGDGAIGDAESCDGAALNSQTCVTQGFTSGTLACLSNCTFNTSGCVTVNPAVCGNGVIEGDEVCDGAALNSQTCVTQGFVSGSLSCNAGCTFNTSACSNAVCGNGIIDSGEACDGAALNSETCTTQGFDAGTLTCSNLCEFNTSACTINLCGNGIVTGSEQCDGANLNSQTCLTRGYDAGTLACTSICAFDVSGCTYNSSNSKMIIGGQITAGGVGSIQ